MSQQLSPQQQQKLDQIAQQNKVFYEAYQTGKISWNQYTEVMNYQNQLSKQVMGSGSSPEPTKPVYGPAPPPSRVQAPPTTAKQIESVAAAERIGASPSLGTRYDFTKIEPQIPTGQKVSKATETQLLGPFLPGQPRQALQIETAPDPKSALNVRTAENEVEAAMQKQLQLERVGQPTTLQGTRGKELTIEQYAAEQQKIRSGLSPEGLKEFEAAQQARVTDPVKRTALFVGGFLAAPIVGPTGVAVGAGGGVAVTQGIKTVGQILAGEKSTIITPEEAFEGATAGVILGGAGKLVDAGVKAVGAGKLVEGFGKGAAQAVSRSTYNIGKSAGIGAGANFVLSGGDFDAAIQGAAFGAGLGAFGEAAGAIAPRVLGVKGIELSKYTEATRTETVGKSITTQRISAVEPKNVRVPYRQAMRIQKQLESVSDLKLELAGTKRTTTIGRDIAGVPEQITTYGRVKGLSTKNILEGDSTLRKTVMDSNLGSQATGTRLADPIISAVRGERFEAGKVRLIKTQTPAGEVRGVQSTKISTGESTITTVGSKGASKPGTFLEQRTITKTELPTQTKSQLATFDKLKLVGSLKDDIASLEIKRTWTGKTRNPLKALPKDLSQKIYKEQGGGYRDLANAVNRALKPQELKSSPMKPGTNKFFRGKDTGKPITTGTDKISNIGKSITEVKKQTTTTQKTPTVTIERPIIKLDFRKGPAWSAVGSAKSVWGTAKGEMMQREQTRQRQKENVSSFTATPITGSQKPGLTSVLETGNAPVLNTEVSKIIQTDSPTFERDRFKGMPIRPIPRPISFDDTKDDSKRGTGSIPVVIPKPIPIQDDSQSTSLLRIPKTAPEQTQPPQSIIKTPTYPKRKTQGLALFPGGGSGKDLGMFSKRKGYWWRTKNPFPEPDQVFKQVLGTKSIDVFKQTKTSRTKQKASKNRRGKR